MDHVGTILVTGATGFIGSQLCRALAAEGRHVRALHRRTSSLKALDGVAVDLHVGDILDPASLEPALRGVSLVFHAAAQSAYWRRPQDVLQAAVDGTRNVVEAARRAGVRRVVLTSSVAALGVPAAGELLDEAHPFNLPPGRFLYGFSKARSEEAARQAAGSDLELVIVNPSIVLGAGDVNRISGSIILESARGRAFVYTDGGANYVHIDDVTAGHLAAAARGRPGERYILGGENLTHRQALTEVARVVGRRPPWLRIPGGLVPPLASALDLVGRAVTTPLNGAQLRMSRHRLWVDTSKSHSDLGLAAPRPFSLAAQEAYDWYRSAGMI
ncbi:MAG: Epimerase protein [Anaerolineales bacterium]|nr:Epimerase protein [Anaerolineales bacterium]